MTSTERENNRRRPLVTAGEFFLDLIFYDLERLPVLGEELKTDCFLFSFGGGAAITAATAARLGIATQLMTILGDSAMDVEARRLVGQFGIGMDGSDSASGTSAGLTVSVSTRADRYFLTYPGANKQLESFLLSEGARDRLNQASHVHFAMTPSSWAPFHALVRDLKKHGVATSWDLGWDPKAGSDPGFKALWRDLDLLFLNKMEALLYSACEDLHQALRALSTAENTIVVKLGSEGSVAICGKADPVWGAPVQVKAVETTGAGDAFNGGFLYKRLVDGSLAECLLAGNACGALSTRAAGGVSTLPSLQELRQVLQQPGPPLPPTGSD